MFGRRKNKRETNFDLNIVSLIDVMSVLTTFLLMVTVWVHLGSLDVSQATGESGASKETPASITAELDVNKNIILSIKNSKVQNGRYVVASVGQKINFDEVTRNLESIKARDPELVTGIIYPSAQTKYDELIHLMDQFKVGGIKDIGISPL